MKRTAVVAFVFLLFTLVSAFNHPELQWKSVTTAHFIINYYDRTEPAVYATWKIAEEAYASLASLYDYEERERINISLADYDDYANGFASWTNGSIMIWVTDIRFDLRGNNTWLNNVITHELSHIMTLEKKQKRQLLDWTVSFGYSSPSDTLSLTSPCATTRFYPEWFTEGIAQRESERRGNDCWDSKRDMLLREAVINNRVLSLDEMGHFNHNSLGNEMVYNQGFAFIKFVEEKIGTPSLTRIINSNRNTALISDGFYSMFENQTGQPLDALYRQWIDSLKVSFGKRIPQNPTQTTMVWNKGFLNSMPKVSRDGKWWGWLTNNRDDGSRTDLVIAPYGSSDPFITIQWALTSWDFSADSKKAYFIKSHEISDNGSYYNDLYVADLFTKKEKRLTRNARIYDVAACPDNERIACVQFKNGAFSIMTAGTNGCCWETLAEGIIGRPFAGLSYSPVKTIVPAVPASVKVDSADARGDSASPGITDTLASLAAVPQPEYTLVTSRYINGKGTLCKIGCTGKTVTMIGSGTAQEGNPHWSKDGRIYFDADYDGTFNIYSVNSDGAGLARHTDAMFGMQYPFTDDNGKLLCVSYGKGAFSVVSCVLSAGTGYTPPKQYACAFADLPRPKGEVTIKSRPYEARLLRSVWELQSAFEVQDENGTISQSIHSNSFNRWMDSAQIVAVTGIVMGRSDALEKKSTVMGIVAAVEHTGIARKDTIRQNVSGMESAMQFGGLNNTDFTTLMFNGKQRRMADRTGSSLLRMAPLVDRLVSHSSMTAATTATDSTTDSTNNSSLWIPVFVPSFSYMNNENTISFGLNADVTVMYVIPYVFQIQGIATWHIARDFYAGCFPGIQIVPIAGFVIPDAVLPLTVAYSTYGYVNTDIGYNNSGITQVQLAVAPESFLLMSSSDTSKNLASYPRASALTVAFSAMHGFPLTMYSSINLRTEDSYRTFSEPVSDRFSLLPGHSTEYLFADVGASVVFPLWRQINGGPAYADALYGDVGYDVQMLTNTTTFENDFTQAFVKSSADKDHVCVSHVFSAGVKLGFFKSFLFSRTLSAKAYWNVWRQKFAFNLSIGM
jgi:hypothetical protein